ncbi:tetratricopeptide repeat protein [Clostridium uliginosum]|uniref:Uncharacterized protein n=1 Tax=Clostridium uliginosum TaxID=119641 RepID=A0A1I1JLQ5_9CLOT|nr:hypothetical protein [Clostridium uliginosum]SFC49549.1 hypothetical protein SAMN05421842_10488 [Clostridium uliginosum]
MNSQREILLSFEKEKLVDIIIELLGKLHEFEKNEFISKNIDSQLALDNIRNGDGFDHLQDVKKFCEDCLNGEYYIECSHDNYWDNYCEDSFESSEWSQRFTEYFNIAMMYSRNKEYDIAFEAFELLFNCLYEAESDEEILGTEEPDTYIEINWLDIFEQYYLCMKNSITDKIKMVEKALEVWLNYGERCTEAIINNIEDIYLIDKIIRQKVEETDGDWTLQHLYFELFKKFNERYNPQFNKIELAKSFLSYNVNFYIDIAKEYFEFGQFEDAVKVIDEALEKVEEPRIKFNLKTRLVDCYEILNSFEKAFNIINSLFKGNPSYKLYNRARYFAEKINQLNTFINEAISLLGLKTTYDSESILIKVLSHEGLIEELLDFIKIYKGYSRHNYLKYISKALIYRGFHGQEVKLVNLNEYINNIDSSKIEGIVDIEVFNENVSNKDYYLNSAADILKEMIGFHIDAATRSRYERAAYYCSIVKDILCFLNKEEEFLDYYTNIIKQNSRRPALKDEMKKKIEQ